MRARGRRVQGPSLPCIVRVLHSCVFDLFRIEAIHRY